jgi:hypothetical protein
VPDDVSACDRALHVSHLLHFGCRRSPIVSTCSFEPLLHPYHAAVRHAVESRGHFQYFL